MTLNNWAWELGQRGAYNDEVTAHLMVGCSQISAFGETVMYVQLWSWTPGLVRKL